MRCPRCSATVPANPDASGFLLCPSCGARLRSKSSSAGRTPTPVPLPSKKPDIDAALARLDSPALSPDATLPPTPSRARGAGLAPPAASLSPAAAPTGATLERVLAELAEVRRVQQEILDLLRGDPSDRGPAASRRDDFAADDGAATPPSGTKRRSVLLIDDDVRTLNPAVDALQRAGLAVRAVQDGNAGLAAIAQEKPDVVVMELDLAGAMGGKDVVNLIKATMEWVDIPIILHTRVPVENQKEARAVHGADDLVLKSPDSAQTLATRVTGLLRK